MEQDQLQKRLADAEIKSARTIHNVWDHFQLSWLDMDSLLLS